MILSDFCNRLEMGTTTINEARMVGRHQFEEEILLILHKDGTNGLLPVWRGNEFHKVGAL